MGSTHAGIDLDRPSKFAVSQKAMPKSRVYRPGVNRAQRKPDYHRCMWIVAIAWMYVAVTMAVAEACHPGGSLVGAALTLLLYGLAPLSLLLYLMATPARRRRQRALHAGAARQNPSTGTDHDGGGHAAADAVAAKREEP